MRTAVRPMAPGEETPLVTRGRPGLPGIPGAVPRSSGSSVDRTPPHTPGTASSVNRTPPLASPPHTPGTAHRHTHRRTGSRTPRTCIPCYGDCTFAQTTFNTVNLLVGVAMLSLPYAMRRAGWLVVLALLVALCALTNYTGRLLAACMEHRPQWLGVGLAIRSYPDIGEAAFGAAGRVFIGFLFVAELFGACCMFLIMMGDHLAALLPSAPGVLGFTRVQSWILVAACVVLPTTWTSELRLLSYTSLLGIISSLVLALVLFFAGQMGPSVPDAGGSLWHPEPMHAVGPAEHIPLALGLVMAGFSGHACLPSINVSMRRRSEYPLVLNVSYLCTLVLYAFVGLCGYMMYGPHTDELVSLNLLRSSPGAVSTATLALLVVNPGTKFGTTMHTGLAQEFEYFVLAEKDQAVAARIAIRTALSALITVCAVAVPSFARVVSFFGASCCFVVSGAFPVACYLKMLGRSLSWWSFVAHSGLLVLCSTCAVVGTIGAVRSDW